MSASAELPFLVYSPTAKAGARWRLQPWRLRPGEPCLRLVMASFKQDAYNATSNYHKAPSPQTRKDTNEARSPQTTKATSYSQSPQNAHTANPQIPKPPTPLTPQKPPHRKPSPYIRWSRTIALAYFYLFCI